MRLIPLFFLIAFSHATLAEETQPVAIWKLEGEKATIYLAGSVHLLREQDLPFPEAYNTVYEDSEELVYEIDMKEMSSLAGIMKMRTLGTLPAGEDLADHLSKETIEALDAYLAENNLQPGMFNQFTPGMVYVTLGSMEAIRQGARPDLGMESQFHKRATLDGKPGSGLETMEYQMSRFNELDIETLDKLIHETLEATEKNDETLDAIIRAWKSGNTEELGTLIHDEMADTPVVAEILLTERNRNWIPAIEEKLAGDTNVMFIVGAAHLAGEGSVIEMLKEKGHQPIQLGTEK